MDAYSRIGRKYDCHITMHIRPEGRLRTFGIETLTGDAHAVAIVGFVLLESMTLYVGYGTLATLV